MTILTVRLSQSDAAHVLGDHVLAKLRAERPDWFRLELSVVHVEMVERQRGCVDVELTIGEPACECEPNTEPPLKRSKRKAVAQ